MLLAKATINKAVIASAAADMNTLLLAGDLDCVCTGHADDSSARSSASFEDSL